MSPSVHLTAILRQKENRATSIQVPRNVDLGSYLATIIAGGQYIYREENDVQYYELENCERGKRK